MNKRHYEHTLPNIRGSLSNTYGRSGSSIKQKPTTEEQTYGFCGENITIQAHSHYNCFRKKKIILPEKQKGIHSEKSKRLKRTANLVAKYPTTYLQP